MLSAHQSIGVPQPLLLFGTDEQKKAYLPRLAKGAVSAFALTEPEVGSDPARLSTKAVPVDGGSHYVLNGKKLWCTNGAIADLLVVMAETPPVVVHGKEKKQITAFIVETSTPGFKVLHRCRFMGLNGIQNALLEFKDVKVPKENIIWGTGQGPEARARHAECRTPEPSGDHDRRRTRHHREIPAMGSETRAVGRARR